MVLNDVFRGSWATDTAPCRKWWWVCQNERACHLVL